MDPATSSAWIQNGRPSMRSSIQIAHERLKPWRQNASLSSLANCQSTNAAKHAVFGQGQSALSNMRFFVKFDDLRERRGVVHAMLCLIEKVGLQKLQQAGVACYYDGTEGQRLYVKEVAAAGTSYGIPTNVLVPPSTLPTVIQGLQSDGIIVTVIEEKRHPDLDPVAAAIAKIGAHRFPSHNEANVVSGQGTVALELENEVAQLLAMKPSPPERNMPGLHAIISVVGTASALSGICMACERTGTRVFGAETVPDPILDTHGPNFSSIIRGEERYDFDVPMGDLPFSTFTARGLLSAVLYAEQSTAARASEALLQQCGVHVTPRDVAPLAVGLYNEDFHRFVRKTVARGQVVNVGVIVQADQTRLGGQRPGTVEFFPGEDLHDGLESLFL